MHRLIRSVALAAAALKGQPSGISATKMNGRAKWAV